MVNQTLMITVDDQHIHWQPEMTMASLLSSMDRASQVAVVRMNGKLVSRPNFDHTPVPQNATIDLIPLIAGG